MPVDNEFYNQPGDIWWDEREFLSTLRTMVNPARVRFFRDVLLHDLQLTLTGLRIADVGCGGGILAEEFAHLGLCVTGVDRSLASVATARSHAGQSNVQIDYLAATGEELPFPDCTYDVAVCGDVLEHVAAPASIIAEIARVLKPGGVFFYDTINRTVRSRIAVIGAFQNWKSTGCAPPHLHDWSKFIKPRELRQMLEQHGLEHRGRVGMQPRIGKLQAIREMRKRRRGEISCGELGRRMEMRASADLSISYMGWAVKSAVQ